MLILLPFVAVAHPLCSDNSTCSACFDVPQDCGIQNLSTCRYVQFNAMNATADCSKAAKTAALRIQKSERKAAWIQLIFASFSMLLCVGYMACFALLPNQLWWFPGSLAFWIYVCDLLVSLHFVIAASDRLQYPAKDDGKWLVSSSTHELCHNSLPGCLCSGGVMSFMLQAGVVGSVAFFCAMAHNEYRSIRNPFRKPSDRLVLYHVTCWSAVVLLSLPYLINARTLLTGYGYRNENVMCWGPNRHMNIQLHLTATLPILLVLMVAPVLHCYSRHLLRTGGEPTREMLKHRTEQLKQSSIVVSVFAIYWIVVGVVFLLGWAPGFFASSPSSWVQQDATDAETGVCTDYASFEVLSVFQQGNPGFSLNQSYCMFIGAMQSLFSAMLSLLGAVNATTGIYTSRVVLKKAWRTARTNSERYRAQRAKRRLLGIPGSRPITASLVVQTGSSTSGSQLSETEFFTPVSMASDSYSSAHALGDMVAKDELPDMSESLREEVVMHTLNGIKNSTLRTAPVPLGSTGPHSSRLDAEPLRAKLPERHVLKEAAREFIEQDLTSVKTEIEEDPTSVKTETGRVMFGVYAPSLWEWLRHHVYGVPSKDFAHSMSMRDLGIEGSKFSEAKGGGFFFYTCDGRYMVKTIDKQERLLFPSEVS